MPDSSRKGGHEEDLARSAQTSCDGGRAVTAEAGAGAGATKKIPLVIRVYGGLCLADGIVVVPGLILLIGLFLLALAANPDLVTRADPTLSLVMTVVNVVLMLVNAVCLVFFGSSLLRSHRRNVVRWANVLIGLTVAQLIISVVVGGISTQLIQPGIQLAILVALSVTIDPSLTRERWAKRKAEEAAELADARAGMLGRDTTGRGYLKLNFFNLFWTFMVCCVIGLVLEVIWHMVVVDPGVYQDRAGLLYGPFSPIYGFGALLMTVALNRLYDKSPVLIFLASAVIGGLFEVAVSLFMQFGFGAVAWDYSSATLFGVVPDPVARLFAGRTSTMFASIWGILGLVWIKALLPQLLKLINLIPWKLRYSMTTVCAALMLVNGIMTLQALDCWYLRLSGVTPTSPVEQFYARHYDDDFMQARFESMTITPSDSARIDAVTEEG